MNGEQFYLFLRNFYATEGQPLYGNYTFKEWRQQGYGALLGFRFNIDGGYFKTIPGHIIVAAWAANRPITNDWVLEQEGVNFHQDCRYYILNYLLDTHSELRHQ